MTIAEITLLLNAELVGNCDTALFIESAEQLQYAQSGQITFIGSRSYLQEWPNSEATAAIVGRELGRGEEPGTGRAFLLVDDADLAMAQLLEAFQPPPAARWVGIHPTAWVDKSARLGNNVSIGAHCYVGPNVELSDGVVLYPQVSVFDGSRIGSSTVLWSGTVVREGCIIGAQCLLHSNVSIGADGFGFRPAPGGRGVVKIPHLGNVVIGHGVEIGANSCVDRGKFSATRIGDGSKIDNLVQIAHNVQIGKVCLIAANVGIAGSAVLGDGVMVGGGASIKDHVKIGSGAVIAACAGIIGDVAEGQRMLGSPAGEARKTLKEWVTLRQWAQQLQAPTKQGKDHG